MTKAGAFAFILEKRFEGVILSGTKSPDHLEENWRAYGKRSPTAQAADLKKRMMAADERR